MKYLPYVAVVVLSVGIFFFAIAYAQTSPGKVKGNPTASWIAPTQNEDGTPLDDLGGYEIFISSDPANPEPSVRVITVPPDQTSIELDLYSMSSGQYSFWIRAYDLAGNRSQWAAPALVDLDTKKPKPPAWERIK